MRDVSHPLRRASGFTLSELLITLWILGVIATYTIPKVLSAQQDRRINAIAKEAFGTISQARMRHEAAGLLNSNTNARDLTPYLNYVQVKTTGSIDDRPTGTSINCLSTRPCLVLHSGAILQPLDEYFSGTATTNYIPFTLDPDGVYTGQADSLRIFIYYNGRIVSRNNVLPNSASNVTTIQPVTNGDPAWFSWD